MKISAAAEARMTGSAISFISQPPLPLTILPRSRPRYLSANSAGPEPRPSAQFYRSILEENPPKGAERRRFALRLPAQVPGVSSHCDNFHQEEFVRLAY